MSEPAEWAPRRWVVDARAEALMPVRHDLGEYLRDDLGLDADRVAEAELVAGELLANAVRHAPPLPDGTVELVAEPDDVSVQLRVTDGGAEQSLAIAEPSLTRPHGRGLRIVAQLSRAWGVDEHPDGRRTVWAALLRGRTRRRTQ